MHNFKSSPFLFPVGILKIYIYIKGFQCPGEYIGIMFHLVPENVVGISDTHSYDIRVTQLSTTDTKCNSLYLNKGTGCRRGSITEMLLNKLPSLKEVQEFNTFFFLLFLKKKFMINLLFITSSWLYISFTPQSSKFGGSNLQIFGLAANIVT